jgi:hypothetical protein
MIVPLGSAYLELIAVVDEAEAAGNRRGLRVGEAVAAGRRFVTWAVRTHDLDAFRAALLSAAWTLPEIRDGSRLTPEGRLLRWRTQELGGGALPFVIEWKLAPEDHPGRLASSDQRVEQVVLESADAGARERLGALLGEAVPHVVQVGALEGVRQARVSGPGGTITIA